jgi:hypothetical protein
VLASVPNTLLIANDLAGTAHRVAQFGGNLRASFAAYLIEATCDITLDGAISKSGNTLRYQPIDGSPAHFMIDPTHNTITDFAWSPSGSKLGVLQLRKSSDVVFPGQSATYGSVTGRADSASLIMREVSSREVASSATRPAALAVSPIRCHSSPNHRNRVKHRDCPAKRHDP